MVSTGLARKTLVSIFEAAIQAVAGKRAVADALKQTSDFRPDMIIAVGKAADDMCQGAHAVLGDSIPALVATKYEHVSSNLSANPAVTTIESGHPIPDEQSLLAGRLLAEAVSKLAPDSVLLLLVSGGASSIAEQLPEGMSLQQWQDLNKALIASGKDIGHINRKRQAISQIKGGQLLEKFLGKQVVSFAISDVQGDSIAVIGSGIGDIKLSKAAAKAQIVASNQLARQAAAKHATKLGLSTKLNVESLYDDVFKLSTELGAFLRQADNGLYIWGGEPTIKLPPKPGNGGRNQSLALALAKEIAGLSHINVLVAGTDGTDGPTDAAGAIIDGNTFQHPERAQAALDQANAGDYLRSVNDILITGPTGTNVMDLVIVLVQRPDE